MNQATLKDNLHYDPLTGIFTWLKGQRKGKIAGTKHISGRYQICLNQTIYLSHRLAWLYMTNNFVPEIDHKDHNQGNNKWNNLRSVTHKENQKNQSLKQTNTSGIMGVSWSNIRQKWCAQIQHENKAYNLGRFNDFFEACCARKSALNHFGFHKNHG